MTATKRVLLPFVVSLEVVCLIGIAGCGGGSNRDYPEVNPAAELASSIKVQLTMLPTLAKQGPQNGKLGVQALLQTLETVDEKKAGEYWATLQEIQTVAQELNAFYEGSGASGSIQGKILELAQLARSLPDDMVASQQKRY